MLFLESFSSASSSSFFSLRVLSWANCAVRWAYVKRESYISLVLPESTLSLTCFGLRQVPRDQIINFACNIWFEARALRETHHNEHGQGKFSNFPRSLAGSTQVRKVNREKWIQNSVTRLWEFSQFLGILDINCIWIGMTFGSLGNSQNPLKSGNFDI